MNKVREKGRGGGGGLGGVERLRREKVNCQIDGSNFVGIKSRGKKFIDVYIPGLNQIA